MVYLFILISNFFNINTINEPSAMNLNSIHLAERSFRSLKVEDSLLIKSMQRGSALYSDFCLQCHMQNGSGVAGTFPPLAKSDFLNENIVESIKAVKYGIEGEIIVNGNTYNSAMPAPGLYDDEVADVMNYILNSWGNKADGIITEADVNKIVEE